MRKSLQDGSVEVTIPSDLNEGQRIREVIESQLRLNHFDEKEIFGIRLALDEAIVNAIKHGNKMDGHKYVRINFRVQPERFDINITDEGNGYDPGQLPDPLADENLERPSGRGIFLMRHYMTEVTIHAPGNRLTMCKVRKKAHLNGNSNGDARRAM